MLNDILWPDHMQWQPPTDQSLYRTRPFTEFGEVSIEHLRRVWHADRGRILNRTPGPVLLGLAYVLLIETNPISELVAIFSDYTLRISLGTFSILLAKDKYNAAYVYLSSLWLLSNSFVYSRSFSSWNFHDLSCPVGLWYWITDRYLLDVYNVICIRFFFIKC